MTKTYFCCWAALCLTAMLLEPSTNATAARNVSTTGFQYTTIRLPVKGAPVSRRRYYSLRHPNYVTRLRSRQKISGVRATIKTGERQVVTGISRTNRTSSKDWRLLMQVPASQQSVNLLRGSYNKHKLRSRAEHRRMWRDIYKARSELVRLKALCETMEKNSTSIMNQLERHKKDFHNYQTDSFHKIQQIESHQATQDRQYFEVFEAAFNNSEKISQLQQVVDGLQELYEGVGESAALERTWNSVLREQEDLELQYEDLTEEKESPEEIAERSYRRVMDELHPQLDRQHRAISDIKRSIARHSAKLEGFSSSINDQHNQLQSSLSSNRIIGEAVVRNNHTLAEVEQELHSTKRRVNMMELQARYQANDYSALRATVSKLNHTLMTGKLFPIRRSPSITETTVFREQVEGLFRALRHQSHRLANLSRSLRSANDDVHYLTMTTSNVYTILTKQAKAVHQQNETLTLLVMKTMQHEDRISDMESDLEYHHEMVMKLLNIVTNLAQQIRRPIPQHKDCHDLWMSGHTEEGVYALVHNMKTTHVYCNMTSNGGWTVVQRRKDGTQDFDRNMQDYRDGFGNVYGEYWLGLDTIRWLTHGRIYTLMVILEDWGGNKRYAIYDRFLVFGPDYVLVVSGYNGDAGNSLAQNNQQTFKVRKQDRQMSVTSTRDCTTTRKAGWWFSSLCGDANPNGPYMNDPVDLVGDRGGNMIGGLRWMTWRGEDYPLKKISMQIIPREALDEDAFQLFPSSNSGKDNDNDDATDDTTQEAFNGESLDKA